MLKTIRIANVGPALRVQGGISRVIELISLHLPAHFRFQQIATFTRFTGDKGIAPAERGSRVAQLIVYLVAFLKLMVLALGRRTIFHVHFAGRGSLIRKGPICVMLRCFHCQYVVHSHAADTQLFADWMPSACRQLLLWGLAGAGRVIVLTQFWYDYYASILKLPAGRLLLLPNPADLPASVPDRSARQGLRLLFLGRIGTRKGAFDLVHALAALPQDVRGQCHLTLAGDGEANEARTLAGKLGCSDQLSLPGWVGTEQVAELLRAADVVVLPSHAEGMAMALVEGMSWGLPVITASVGGAGEFLQHGANCLLVTPGHIGEIRDAIALLLTNPVLRRQLGNAARETISRFSIDRYIVTLNTVYLELANHLPGRSSSAIPATQT